MTTWGMTVTFQCVFPAECQRLWHMQGHLCCLPSFKSSGYTETGIFITKEYDGHKDTNLEYSLILYPFSKILVVSLSWGLWVPQPWILSHIYSIRHTIFLPVDRSLVTSRKWMVTSKTFVPLLHSWRNLAVPVIIVVHNVHSWLRSADSFSLSSLHGTFQH